LRNVGITAISRARAGVFVQAESSIANNKRCLIKVGADIKEDWISVVDVNGVFQVFSGF